MPTYDYLCNACQHRFELFQSITEDPVKVCPKCGKKKVHRLIGPGGAVIFKGSGFYITDYRSQSYKKAAAAEKSDGAASSSDGKSSGGDGKSATASSKKKQPVGAADK